MNLSFKVFFQIDITNRCNKLFLLTHVTAAQRSPRSSSHRRHKKKSKRKRRKQDAEDSAPAAAVEATAPVPAPHAEAAPAQVTPTRQDTPTSSLPSRDGRSWLSHSPGPAHLTHYNETCETARRSDSGSDMLLWVSQALDSAPQPQQPSRRSLTPPKVRTRQPEVVRQSSLASDLGDAALDKVGVKPAQLPAMTAPAAAASPASDPPPPREAKRQMRRGARVSRFNADDEESIYPEANPNRPVAAMASSRQPTPLARPIAAATLRPAPPLVTAPAATMQPLWAAQVSGPTADDILDKYDDSDSDDGLGGTVIQRAPLPRTKPESRTDGLLAAAPAASIVRVLPPVPGVQPPPVPLPGERAYLWRTRIEF